MITTKKIKSITVNNYKIEHNKCTGVNCRIYSKRFSLFVKSASNNEDNHVTVNHIEIIKLMNEAQEYCLINTADETILKIETKDYVVYAVIHLNNVKSLKAPVIVVNYEVN